MGPSFHDVAIIGGGVIGCAIAHELGRYRADVILFEAETEVGFGTSKANSGIIHGGHHTSHNTLKGQLEWHGNRLWGDLCEELGFGFERVGDLTVALGEQDLPELDRLLAQAEAKGVPGVERWTREQVLAAEPNLNTAVVAAVHAPSTAVVNPYEACFGLAESAAHQGVAIRTDSPVRRLQAADDGWTVTTPSSRTRARFVVNAAGLAADHVADLAGVGTFTIRARKGEEYLLDKRLQGLVDRVIYPCPQEHSKGTLVIPTYDGTIMIGPTADEVDDRDDYATTEEGASRVLDGARRLVPGISERDIIAEFAGSRAVLDGDDFLIGPTTAPGFINVAGIQSPGLTAAPAIARMVVDLLQAQGLELEPEVALPALHRPVHFDALTTEQQTAVAADDVRYRRIVCRCEAVTEGEVGDAIERGARTLDGLKFRTRVGMGRCQGGFCTPRCIELLSQQLDVPMHEVTKRGGGSWLVIEREPPGAPR